MQAFRSSTFTRTLSMMLLIFMVPMLILGGWLLAGIAGSEADQYQKGVAEAVNRFGQLFDEQFGLIRSATEKLMWETWVRKLIPDSDAFLSEFGVLRRQELYRDLLYTCSTSPLIHQIAILFPYKNLAVSSVGFCTLDECIAILVGTGTSGESALRRSIAGRHTFDMTEERVWVRGTAQDRECLIFAHGVEDTSNPRATIVLLIDGERMTKLLDAALGPFICGVRLELPGGVAFESADGDAPAGEHRIISDAFGWGITLYERTRPGGVPLAAQNVLLTLLALFLGCALLSLGMAYRSLLPLNQLLDKSAIGRPASRRLNEFEILKEHIGVVQSERDVMRRAVAEYREIVRRQTIRTMLAGVEPVEFEKLRTLNIDYRESDRYCVLLIATAANVHAQRDWISARLDEFSIHSYQFVEGMADDIAVILCFRAEDKAACDRIAGDVCRAIGSRYMAWRGVLACGPRALSESYASARRERETPPLSSVERQTYYYPSDTQHQIVNNLKCGNRRAIEMLRELEKENRELGVDEKSLERLIRQLLADGIRVMDESGWDAPALPPRADTALCPSEAFDFVAEFFDGIITAAQTAAGHSRNMMLSLKIIGYIDSKLDDQALSLTDIAERFALSEPFVSKLFKEAKGINFSDYLARRRIDRAKALMRTTDLTIAEISGKVGYGTDHTFRRVFKRYEGVTPSEYAALWRREENSMEGGAYDDQGRCAP